MKIIDFNKNWICYETGKRENAFAVSIPHDALLLDEKADGSAAGVNLGWYVPKDYTYEKTIFAPKEWENIKNVLYFEGVYHKATVYINEKKAAYQEYGYNGFYVDLTTRLNYGQENSIRVEAVNTDQPNSRWYSGTGIYRPVWLYQMPKEHILIHGIKAKTTSIHPPHLEVKIDTNTSGNIDVEIPELSVSCSAETNGTVTVTLSAPDAKLWNTDTPKLYTLRVIFGTDVREEKIGFRMITFNDQVGFAINGNRCILKGACIHHDNGLLGACDYDFASRRKIRLLKEHGYNAIRSAHNPTSESILRACDELGILVIDEYSDVWYIHKTKYDYAAKVETNYKEDLKFLVDRDYNHPSVIMYSTGNEVAETAQKRGIQLCGDMTRYLHELDLTRPVTCGINIFFNFLSSMGLGVYSDKKASNIKKKTAVGSEFFNILAGIMGAEFMKFGATLYPCDLRTKDAFANMDIAGYNYGIKRYKHDLKKYKHRLILGSETFCSDAYHFIELAKKEKRIIGDFVWAGIDYLGEVGIGSWEYKDYAPDFSHGKGWVLAGSGRLDITGKPLSEAEYTKVAFEKLDLAIGVIPAKYAKERHSPSAWKMTNAYPSWSWNGCEGMPTTVEVYSRAAEIELFLNGKSLGKKKRGNNCRITFPVTYMPGTLTARAYDESGKPVAEKSLVSASSETILKAEPELDTIRIGSDLAYVRLRLTDQNGIVKPLERAEIKVEVTGGTLIGLGSGCPYYEKSYLSDVCDTYYGEAMAIIKPDKPGKILLKASSKYTNAQVTIIVK